MAIVYHDDNENRIPHAHVVVNNTNVETGRRLHVPDPKGLNRDLQEMARKRDLGYFTDNRMTANPRVKGGEARTRQMEFKGRAERRIEREGGYSWVADIRSRAQTARALARDEASYRGLLETLGVELSLNSPNARRRDYLYALADHPARKVSGEKLGWSYGKQALEYEWVRPSHLKDNDIAKLAENAILIEDLDELRDLAETVKTLKDYRFASIDGIGRTAIILERHLERAESQQERANLVEKIEQVGRARRFAAEHGVLPAKDPEYVRTHPYSQRTSMSWGGSSNSHRSSSSQEHSVERSRSDWAR